MPKTDDPAARKVAAGILTEVLAGETLSGAAPDDVAATAAAMFPLITMEEHTATVRGEHVRMRRVVLTSDWQIAPK